MKTVIFDATSSSETVADSQADDNIEDDEDPIVVSEDDETINKVVPAVLPGVKAESDESKPLARITPTKYVSFSKTAQNAKLLAEQPKFSEEFTLTAWLRRPVSADKNVKEHVLCGTDSKVIVQKAYFNLPRS